MFVEIFIELLVYSGGLHNKLVFPHKNEGWDRDNDMVEYLCCV